MNIMSFTSNGTNYSVRFDNGLQVCWGTISINVTSWGTWGNLSESSNAFKITYAQSFLSTPSLTMNARLPRHNCWVECPKADDMTESYADAIYLLRGNQGDNNISGYIDYVAIGKWK